MLRSVRAYLFIAVVLVIPITASAEIFDVDMSGLSFVPASLTIQVGDMVRWTNVSGAIQHTTTSGTPGNPSGMWDSGLLADQQTFMFEFTAVGEYPYYCIPHGGFGMVGNITVEAATGIDTPVQRPFELGQNYPNPFNPTTTIQYTIEQSARVRIDVFTARGQLIDVIENELRPAGTFTITWDAVNNDGVRLTSGIYFYQLRLDGVAVEMKRMVLLK